MWKTTEDGTPVSSSMAPAANSRRWFWGSLLALTALYTLLVYVGISRHLWFDELLTYQIAKAPSLPQVLALADHWDLNPKELHVLAHASLLLAPGQPQAIRLPSILEFYFASVFLLIYAARKVGPAFAALPVLILWASPMLYYATEARPYAALCFWFCALLLLWDAAVEPGRHRLIVWAIALSCAGLIEAHVLAVLSLLPFFAAEALRFRERREADWPLWLALLLPLLLTVSYVPLFRGYGAITAYPPAFQAGLDKVVSFYWHTFIGVLACLLLAALAAWLVTGRQPLRLGVAPVRWPDAVLYAVLIVLPVPLALLLMTQHSPFWGRYCITSTIGLYVLSGFVLATAFRRSTRAGYAAVVTAGAVVLLQQALLPLYRRTVHPPSANVAFLQQMRPALPIVAASGLTFVEMGQYEEQPIRSRLFYLLDRAAAIQFAHATIFEDLDGFQKDSGIPGTIEPYRQFVRDHPVFLVIGTFNYPEDWLLRKLAASGAVITPLGDYDTPYKDKSLFEVHMTDRSRSASSLLRPVQTGSKACRAAKILSCSSSVRPL